MTDSETLDDKIERNRQQRIDQIERWAEFVRTHSDEEWGRQVNTLVDAQLQAARHAQKQRSSEHVD